MTGPSAGHRLTNISASVAATSSAQSFSSIPEVSFERCHELRLLLDSSDGSDLVDEYREARAAFEHARWQLCVHREAIGLNNHRWIDNIFPMPPHR